MLLRVRADAAPSQVTVGGAALVAVADARAFDGATSGWRHDATSRLLWIKVEASADPVAIVASP